MVIFSLAITITNVLKFFFTLANTISFNEISLSLSLKIINYPSLAENQLNSAENQLNSAEYQLNPAENQLNPAENQLNST